MILGGLVKKTSQHFAPSKYVLSMMEHASKLYNRLFSTSRGSENDSLSGFFRILIPEFIDSDRELRSWSVSETFVPFLGVHLGLGTKRAPPRVVVGFWFAARRSFVDRIGQRKGDKRSPSLPI